MAMTRSERNAAWRKANPGANANWKRANAAKNRAYSAKWRRAHPSYVRDWQRAHPELGDAKWRRANPERVAAYAAAYLARKLGAPGGGISGAQREQIMTESLGLCAYCNSRVKLTLDHIDPLSRGGEHDVENSAATCEACNSSKHVTSLLVWLARRAAA